MEGNIINNEYDEKLIELIHDIGDANEKRELISILNEVNDTNIENDKKLTSVNKLKKFLRKSASKIGEVSFQLLLSYIESKFI